MSFASTPTRKKNAKKPPVSKREKTQIKYPIFEEAAEEIEDSFWKDVLNEAARGYFRDKKIFFNGTTLSRANKRVQPVEIPLDNSVEACSLFVNFHRKHCKIFSPDDMEKRDKNRQEQDEYIDLTWITCSKKTRKALAIEYAQRLCKENDLSELDEEHFIEIFGSLGEYILDKDEVEIENNQIASIYGIRINKENKTIKISNDLTKRLENAFVEPKIRKTRKKQENLGNIAATYRVASGK